MPSRQATARFRDCLVKILELTNAGRKPWRSSHFRQCVNATVAGQPLRSIECGESTSGIEALRR
jgi:hypothetical protein